MVLHGRNIIQLILVACKIMFFATNGKEKYHTKSHNFKVVLVISTLRKLFCCHRKLLGSHFLLQI